MTYPDRHTPPDRQQQASGVFRADRPRPEVPENRTRSAQDSPGGAGQGAEPPGAYRPSQGPDQATTIMLSWFDGSHLQDPRLANWSSWFLALAEHIVEELVPGAERSAGLRHLLEAKDCIVRAQIHTDRIGEDR